MFRVPAFLPYFVSLCLVSALAAVAYLAVPAAAQAFGLVAGSLFVGHLIGSFAGTPRAEDAAAPRPAPQAGRQIETGATAPNGETKTLYVGNIAFRAPKTALQELFENHGRVHSVRLMTDRQTRKPKGYGFVEMDDHAAENALAALDGNPFFGRELRVSIAKQQDLSER